MPTINITEMVSDLKEYLPPEGNNLSDRNLTTISENVVANSIPEDDEAYYSEALCKVRFKYSEENSKDIWRDYIKTLPDLCPYLPKGGYTLPLSIGMIINSGEELKVPFCTSYEDEILTL